MINYRTLILLIIVGVFCIGGNVSVLSQEKHVPQQLILQLKNNEESTVNKLLQDFRESNLKTLHVL